MAAQEIDEVRRPVLARRRGLIPLMDIALRPRQDTAEALKGTSSGPWSDGVTVGAVLSIVVGRTLIPVVLAEVLPRSRSDRSLASVEPLAEMAVEVVVHGRVGPLPEVRGAVGEEAPSAARSTRARKSIAVVKEPLSEPFIG